MSSAVERIDYKLSETVIDRGFYIDTNIPNVRKIMLNWYS